MENMMQEKINEQEQKKVYIESGDQIEEFQFCEMCRSYYFINEKQKHQDIHFQDRWLHQHLPPQNYPEFSNELYKECANCKQQIHVNKFPQHFIECDQIVLNESPNLDQLSQNESEENEQESDIIKCPDCQVKVKLIEYDDHQYAHQILRQSMQSLQENDFQLAQNMGNNSQNQNQQPQNRRQHPLEESKHSRNRVGLRRNNNIQQQISVQQQPISSNRNRQRQLQQNQDAERISELMQNIFRGEANEIIQQERNQFQMELDQIQQNDFRQLQENEELTYEQLQRLDESLYNKGKGLDPEIIENMPTFAYFDDKDNDSQQNCSICQCPYQENQKLKTLWCFHFYHVECIDEWLQRSKACPICKEKYQAGQ